MSFLEMLDTLNQTWCGAAKSRLYSIMIAAKASAVRAV
jgi:hypothetical protein